MILPSISLSLPLPLSLVYLLDTMMGHRALLDMTFHFSCGLVSSLEGRLKGGFLVTSLRPP